MDRTEIISTILRWLSAAVFALFTLIEPAIPYLLLCYAFIMLDCWSAYKLAQRVKEKFPGRATGKFRSEKLRHIFATITEVTVVVLLVHFAHEYIADELPVNITKLAAGAVCGWQFWSYLENSASCNGAKWAAKAKDILVDKTSRHFDIVLDDITPDDNERD